MSQRVQDGFIFLLSTADMLWAFLEVLNLSRISDIPQEYLRPRLILNLSENPNTVPTSFNDTMDREVSPESMKFGRAFSRIIQAIWKSDLS